MKKILAMCACAITVFAVQNAFADCGAACGSTCELPTGECVCKYVQYIPCPYYERSCTYESIPCPRTCCRYVPQYYQVQRCRYVPDYYYITCCRQVPEYYSVCDYKTVARPICIPKCRYVPRYYWRAECRPACPTAPCGTCG